jgi:hypothetical protein
MKNVEKEAVNFVCFYVVSKILDFNKKEHFRFEFHICLTNVMYG